MDNYVILFIVCLIIFLIVCALISGKDSKIAQLNSENNVLKTANENIRKHQDYLLEELKKKEEKCEELRDQVESLWFVLKPSKNKMKIVEGIPERLEKGMTIIIFENGIYKDLIYTGKRAKYNIFDGYYEAKDGSYIFFTPDSKDIIRGVKEEEFDNFMLKIKSYSMTSSM